jgi:glucokinase
MSEYAVGIDVGGTKIWTAIGSREGCIIAERKEDTPSNAARFISLLRSMVGAILSESGRSPAELAGIGIGLPGRVSADGRRLEWIPNLPFLDGNPLADILEGEWRVPVSLENDGRLALYGEGWLGAARGCSDAIMLTLGTGVGGAIMIGGRLHRGARGTAGSMGWMNLDGSDPGGKDSGWLERMVSGSAINRRAAELPSRLDSFRLFAESAEGLAEARGLVEEIGMELGAAIAALVSILDPEIVILGGGVSEHLEALRPAIERSMLAHASPATRSTPVRAAELLARAGMLGALRLAFDEGRRKERE